MKTIDVKEEILSENKYIPPYRLGILMSIAEKITDLLSKNARITISYREIELILKVVGTAINEAKGEEK